MSSPPRHVVLVPGFFGFVSLGEVFYFQHVAEHLGRCMRTLGSEAAISTAKVPPTASLRTRTAALAAHLAETADPRAKIAVVGHSSGGLDARLLVAPGIRLETDLDVEAIANRVDAVISVATPHHGTPLAELFVGLYGQRILRLLSLVTAALLRYGALPVGILAKLGAGLARLRFPGTKTEAILDALCDELAGQLAGPEDEAIGEFVDEVGSDQSLVAQITPAVSDLLNASAEKRDEVRYASVVIAAPKPTIRTQFSMPKRATVQAGYFLYRWLAAASTTSGFSVPELSGEQRAAIAKGFGRDLDASDTDAIVPTLSQVHGRVIWAGLADHLDVIGHFHGPKRRPPHRDWLMTGAHFGGAAFDDVWSAVAAFVTQQNEL